MKTIIAHQGDTVDAIAWRHYGRTRGVVEAILAANPGLADFGPVLPLGTRVQLPDLPTTQEPTRQLVQLWD